MGEDADRAREAAARAALERIEDGMTIGLGSGRAVWRGGAPAAGRARGRTAGGRREETGDRVATEEGHSLLDCGLPAEGDLAALGDAIKATVGVVEHGLFIGLADEALLGRDDGGVDAVGRDPG